MRRRIARKLAILGPWIGVVALSYLAVHFLVLEEPYLSYRNLPFRVQNSPVRAGDAVQLLVRRCNSDDKTRLYAVSHTLDGDGPDIILPATQSSIEPGCHTSTSAINVIPFGTRPGKYRITGYGEVAGTIRTFSVRWESQEFEVIP